jgi:N-acetylmuramoyl-L-alanine amidase
MSLGRQMRWLRCAGYLAGLSCVAALPSGAARAGVDTSAPVRSRAAKKVVALSPWEQAEQRRDALEAIPEETRTRADYARAMDEYRAIYHVNPADLHAAAAVYAVAELLAEQGRTLHDAKSLKAAVGQYEFLRTQYPASSLRVQALLTEGQIEQDDLGDTLAAKDKYKLLLKEHPKSEQAEEARAGLASLEQLPVVSSQLSGKATRRKDAGGHGQSQGLNADSTEPGSGTVKAVPVTKQHEQSDQRAASLPAMARTSGASAKSARVNPVVPARTMTAPIANAAPVAELDTPAVVDAVADSAKRIGKRAVVMGIRHWSTATYTRVAIDLGDNVTYEAARVPNPDRIFFDLHGTRLAQELVGKSFSVTDDGFLKKVRAAQYSDDVTRVVLDVNDVTEYSAFLLPNPYRLIIDIHGSKGAPAGVTIGAPQRRAIPAPTVPNTIAVKQASSAEVAAVSEMPGKVEATTKPTSQPISAVVGPGARPQAQGSSRDGAGSGLAVPGDSMQADPTHRDDAAMNGAPSQVVATPADSSKKTTRKSRAKGGSTAVAPTVADATPARAAAPMADGETSLVRALGLKIGRIVIDAGHGGHDSGTLGVDGIQEKDVVLDVALRLGKLLHDRLGAEIIYTRSDDTFIPLETRTAIANKAQADLFLSIHANSSPEPAARGVETYYLNFTSDPTALDVAARENAVSDQSIHQLSDLVKKIALKDKIAESHEFASDVEGSLYAGLAKGNAGLKDRGVKKAPFVVLIGANMPSILAEISFVTNPKDAEQLAQPEYRERVAESLYKGVARYEGGLSGSRVPTERASLGQ